MLSSRRGLTKFGAVRKIKELAKSEHSFELAQLASRVASAMHAETSTGDVNTHVQHVIDTVEVERPTIIDETMQKPIIQEKINPVTKHVEVSLSQFTDKAMDIPVVAPRQILLMTQTVQKTIEIPQLQCIDEVIDVPAVLVVPVPQVQVSGKTVEISQLQTAEKIVDTFDANGDRVANELRRKDCVMREMRKNKPPFRLALNRADSDEIARHCKYCNERGVTRLYESGTALAEGMRVPVSKMEELIAVHCQTSLKTVSDPDRRPYPACPSGKSWCEACGKMGSGQKFHHNVTPGSDFAAEAQQQHKSSKHQPTKQAMQQRERKEEKGQGEEERRGEKGREENGRKNEEKKVRKEEEKGDNKVVKDVTGWTVVTRNKRQKKMVQIFVKVNGSKATPMEVNLMDDKVEDVMRQIQKDEDVYVTMHGKVLRRDEKLKSYEVTDGCTVEVTSRMRGGGKHKDKKGKEEKKKQVAQLDDGMCAMACEQMRQVMENLKTLADNSTGEDKRRVVENVEELRKAIIGLRKQARGEELQRVAELEESLKKLEEEMLLWSVEEQEQRRQEEQTRQGEQEEQRRQEEQEHAAMRKGKGEGNGGKGEHASRKGRFGGKGAVKMVNGNDEGEEADEEKGGTRNLRWADCEEEEGERQGAAEGEWHKSRKEQGIMWLDGSDEEREFFHFLTFSFIFFPFLKFSQFFSKFSLIFFHFLSFSFIFFHFLLFSFIFFHFLSFSFKFSFIFFHFLSLLFLFFFHFLSFSFIVLSFSFIVLPNVLSFSFIFFHFLSLFFHFLSFCLSGGSKSDFFLGLNFVTISLYSSYVKKSIFGPVSGGTPLGPLFLFFSSFFFLVFFFVFFLASVSFIFFYFL